MRAPRVLLALADDRLVAAYRGCFFSEDFEVMAAQDGFQCLALLQSFRPDVLVLESSLPWGGGDGVLARVREDADAPLLPVIFLSSDHDPEERNRLVPFKVHSFILMPLGPQELAAAIRRVLRQLAEAPALASPAASAARNSGAGTGKRTDQDF